jgi:hypothetical protein
MPKNKLMRGVDLRHFPFQCQLELLMFYLFIAEMAEKSPCKRGSAQKKAVHKALSVLALLSLFSNHLLY